MSYNDQEEPSLPVGNTQKRSSSDLLPRYYRTGSNKKFLQATLDQLTQPGKVKKVNGFIGRQNAKAVQSSDIFVEASDKIRQDYQLEPAALIQDDFENVTFFKDYIDYINQISVFGGITDNHEKLNKQETYSWNPHICWDKLVNFQNYYWLPYGPDPIKVFGQQQQVISTYTVNLVDEGDNNAFLFSPDGLVRNPTLTLFRGQTYQFKITSKDNPFSIKTSRSSGTVNRYNNGVTNNGAEEGIVTFTVPYKSPDVLFYVSENNTDSGGVFHILDIEENTFLNVETDVLGKQTYTMSTGIPLSNGMKLKFEGKIEPAIYSSGYWYVEGVGTAIHLIAETDLEVISTYSQIKELLFDDTPFDQNPFSTANSFPAQKDYITIRRSTSDRNPWSRYNRWFHSGVIEASAAANNKIAEFDQTQRATRPIIEFEADLKLFNFGHKAKANVDLIDTFTKDVFSTIEGSLGYNIDSIDIVDGMRILFTADTDNLVKGKIYKANFINVIIPNRQITFNAATNINPTTDEITFVNFHGLATGERVIYLNNGNSNINGLENRKVYYANVISANKIKLFNDKLLTVPADIFAVGIGTHKIEVFSGIRRQINLTEESDSIPLKNETVLIKQGFQNQGRMYWYDGSKWLVGQEKLTINQAPLFDIFDTNGISYSDNSTYDSSTFKGNKIFSYKQGTGVIDSVLGFPLSYRNINNVGDIVFEFNLLNENFSYKILTDVKSKNTDVGYVKIIQDLENGIYLNGWEKTTLSNLQPIVRIYKDSGLTNNFPIDVYDNQTDLQDLEVKAYINGKRVDKKDYAITPLLSDGSTVDTTLPKLITFNTDVKLTDVITLRCFAKQNKNNNGYYELPLSLQNNPLNNNLKDFTLGEVIDHVGSIVDNINDFEGNYPGVSNLRDLGNLTAFGTRFLQHSGPLNLGLYHFCQQNFNVFKALEKVKNDYAKFKRNFIITASNSGIHTDTREHVDYVLSLMNKDTAKNQPYFLSDMFAYTAYNRLEYIIEDPRVNVYPMSRTFDLKSLSNKSIYIYLNGEQLVYGKDYTFSDDVYFTIIATLEEDDVLEVLEYENTDGAYCPSTPTALGLYPKFEPKKYIDNTYLDPREVIQGHDGSITLCYGDYRDDMLLELEKRIYNNIKIDYDPEIFDIFDFLPGYSRTTDYDKEEFERVMSQFFFQWTSNVNQDYTQQIFWDINDSFTFNYRNNFAPDGREVPAFWRGIYKWMLDTDRPHTHPWECLGFSIEPVWWQEVYGPAPYTSDNFILWDDIQQGVIRQPGKPITLNEKYAKAILVKGKPVDSDGNLISPYFANFAQGAINPTPEGFYVFGDQGPVETAWRRSSYYPFAFMQTVLLLQPNKVLATCLDRSRTARNKTGQLIYTNTDLRIKLSDIVIPNTVNSSTRIFASGLINYIVDYVSSDITLLLDQYVNDLSKLTNKISSRLGAFTSKNKFRLLLDSKSPTSTGGVFVPEENYNIFLNTSSAIKKLVYSGVIITKFPDGFEIRGYHSDEPFFTYYPYRLSGGVIRVGAISESFVIWAENKTYVAGKTIEYQGKYYRAKTTHVSGETFDASLYIQIPELPQVGGREAIIRKNWDYDTELYLAYGTKLTTIQDVADFIQGYGAYLERQGFVFDSYNNNLKNVLNWTTSLKEFLFWTTQNWGEGAVLSLSPAASQLTLVSNTSVVNDIKDSFYGYKIFRVDGQLLEPDFTNTLRFGNEFSLAPSNTNHGIYGAVLYLVQKEHILVLDNSTLFNDVIYDLEPGYRQERIKVLGYTSTNWNGSFNIPGFIFDQAKVSLWAEFVDYNLGDIVKYKEFYYSAKRFLPGVAEFNVDDWYRLTEKPEQQLLPNWDYKSEQFTDFYDLDTDNFDTEQQRLAQHLIGYQKRQYLENIIKDDVSQYKFYQGMIVEKGTKNVLTKLFDVLSSDNQESLTFDEEWALRVGDFGGVDAFEEIEFKLDETLFKLTPQPFELTENINKNVVDYVVRQNKSQIYVKPVGYNDSPWPLGNKNKFLRSPGFVRYDDASVSIDTLDDILSYDITNLIDGDYIWVAFDTVTNKNWNVYRLTKTNFKIENVKYDNGILTFTPDRMPKLFVGDIIGVDQSSLFNGFYKIISILGRTFSVEKELTTELSEFLDSTTIITYKLTSNKVDNINDANDFIPKELKQNELIWVNNNGKNQSAVYVNNPVFDRLPLDLPEDKSELKFGKKIAVSKDGNLCAIANNFNQVYIYNKATSEKKWFRTDLLEPLTNNANIINLGFGTEIAMSPDGEWLAVAAPTASNVRSGWRGEFSSSAFYTFGDVVRVRNTHWSAKRNINNDSSVSGGQDEFRFRQDWSPSYLVPVNSSKSPSSLMEQGYVNIYRRFSESKFALVHSIVSPDPTAYEHFGQKMSFAKNGDEYVLAISAPGYQWDNTNSKGRGRVYLFRFGVPDTDSTISFWAMDYNRNYVGQFSSTTKYFPGDIVLNADDYQLYRCLVDQDPCPINTNPSAWELLTTTQSIAGFFPQIVNDYAEFPGVLYDNWDSNSRFPSPLAQENVEMIFANAEFGYDVRLSANNAKTLIISAPGADDFNVGNYKGHWKKTVKYYKDDIVLYKGGFFRCTADIVFGNNTNPDFDSSLTDWTILDLEDFEYKGEYDPLVSYQKNDVVYYAPPGYHNNANLYIALNDTIGDGSTITDTTQDWKKLFQKTVNTGKVFIYKYDVEGYKLTQTLAYDPAIGINEEELFGESIAINDTGDYIAVGSVLADLNSTDQGKVFIFKDTGEEYVKIQDLYSQFSENREKFGAYVDFMNDGQSLVVFSINGNISNLISFDTGKTTFDNNVLRIVDTEIDTGRVDVFDRYDIKYIYGESLTTPYLDIDGNYTNDITDKYGSSIAVADNNIMVSAPLEEGNFSNEGRVYSYIKERNTTSWNIKHIERSAPDAFKIKKAYLYNKRDNKLITYLDVIDPIQGKLPGIADQEIKFKTFFDPAVYTLGTNDVNVDEGMNWTTEQVGTLWWDLTRAKFLEYSVGEIVFRSANWNKLYKTASIDVYEWVSTKYLPSEWDALSGTEEGFALGISGISKYGDSVYSVKKKYDTVSRTFNNIYFYWVKNPTILSNVEGRMMTAADVSNLIADPVGYGYPCIGLTSQDSFVLANVQNLLEDTNVILNVQYWIIDNQNVNSHSQWKIISENINSIIPYEIENKWINSLIGKDEQNRRLPDTRLPLKLRYGIENRPRQSMFVNRVEALKQFVERVNSVLIKELIVDEYDLTDLNKTESVPGEKLGLYDSVIDTEEELRFIGTSNLQKALLTPIIINGRIVGADIVSKGFGYINAPYLKVKGLGVGASLRTVLDSAGRVTSVLVVEEGQGYQDNTTLEVRSHTVLVNSDSSAFDKWSIYELSDNKKSWNKIKTQSYNVTTFWEYTDWYLEGYNEFTRIDHLVENTYQLTNLETSIGSVVKVKNVGSGGWLLLEKFDNIITIDYTLNYKVIGRQNGTIQFKPLLYTFINSIFGYSGSLYDSDVYDNFASAELRIILNTLKDKIFINELRIEWLKSFFAAIRYTLNEQYFVDWAIKTSFVKSTHHAGELKQKVNYNNDNLEDFENYVNEVKPYRTKVREYVSAYTNLDNTQTSITDFDLLPVIRDNLQISPLTVKIDSTNGQIKYDDDTLLTYPWKFWYDNVGFEIESINIINGGAGYISRPQVRIIGGFGAGAEAKAYITSGKLTRIDLIKKGSGYLKAPTILIDGGLQIGGTPATAVAVIGNSVIRSNKISIKFDRITRKYFVSSKTEIESGNTDSQFVGTGSKIQFNLKFSPVSTIGTSKVTVNGVDVLRDDYKLFSKKSTDRGFVSYYGQLIFKTAPAAKAIIEIEYEKDFNHLSAADRIQFYYDPVTGQLGKDLAQLMNGIDFGGVSITGLGFQINGGWDSIPWYTEGWDGFDAEFDDIIFNAAEGQYSFVLPYVPELDQEINIYVNGKRIDDPYYNEYDGITIQTNGRKVPPTGTIMQTYVGNGIGNTVTIPNNQGLQIFEGTKVIFRKSTSDGSLSFNENDYDTQLSGGNLAYTTATGLAPDDIVLDGEGFVTPTHSHAPEEIVPGHISDAVAIKLFRLPRSGGSTILFKNYICNGTDNEFDIGQFPSNTVGIFVKLDNQILKRNIDFTVDWQAKKIIMTVIPANKKILNVISFGFASDKVLDVNYFVSDGSTVEFITNAPWPRLITDNNVEDAASRLGSVVLVNGVTASYELFETDATYESPHKVGIRLSAAALENSAVTYIITSDANVSLSNIQSQQIAVDGSTAIFNLSEIQLGQQLPIENNILVIKNGLILEPADSTNYNLVDLDIVYSIPQYKSLPYTLDPINISVYINGEKLVNGIDYLFNVEEVTITLAEEKYKDDAILTIVNFTDASYTINNNNIIFADPPLITDDVSVISFYNHDIEKIIRSNERFDITSTLVPGTLLYYRFNSIRGGALKLFRTVLKDDYIWVSKNRQLLSHSVDFYLDDDLRTIKFAEPLQENDKLDVILFNDNNINNGYGYMQFKDMLNRVHYKRISKAKSTRLSKTLLQKDRTIEVVDGSVLSKPNKNLNLPGIIEINGERIEYFALNGNVLSQLRRGTLGTGVPVQHWVTSYVIDIGPTETIPYQDQHLVETFIADGTSKSFPLNYIPKVGTTDWYTENIPEGYGQSNELDVFVGGYRLKKAPYKLFEESNNYPYSPEGDSQFEAEFSVNGTNTFRITSDVPENTKIVVVKKTGRIWEDSLNKVEIFRNISDSNGGAVFDVYKSSKNYFVTLKNPGLSYSVDDKIVLPGVLTGGTSPENDITITVTSVNIDKGNNSALGCKLYPGSAPVPASSIVAGQTYVIDAPGSTNWSSIGAENNFSGTIFVATGTPVIAGTGTAFIPCDIIGTVVMTLAVNILARPEWVGQWWQGGGGAGQIRDVFISNIPGTYNTITVDLYRQLSNRAAIQSGDWNIYLYKDPLQVISQFTYEGQGLETSYVTKSLVDSDNLIANFIKNTETIWPNYITEPVPEISFNFDSETVTFDNSTTTFDKG